MEELQNEQKLTNCPFVTINGTKKILNQMMTIICKIYQGKGTGFFCKIPYKRNLLTVLITNYHIIDENFIKKTILFMLP